MIPNALPKSLADNPMLDRWLHFRPDGRLRVAVGKVELGQGITTALAQIAADELDVPLARIDMLSGDTEQAPDEGSTSSSQSIEVGGASLRLACAEARALFVAEAARALNCPPDALAIAHGAITRAGRPTGQSYWTLAPRVALHVAATGAVAPKPRAAHAVIGRSIARRDLPAKLAGGGFVHDIQLPGMRHARVLRQPRPDARLARLDEAALRKAAGGPLDILRRGDFVALVADSETVARRAAIAATTLAVWDGLTPLAPEMAEAGWLRSQPSDDRTAGPPPAAHSGLLRHQASYSRPYIAHAALGPSCAVAWLQGGQLTLWSHAQGVYILRQALAEVLHLDAGAITVHHAHGAGCYGHNGADDAALDAAVIATLLPGTPIRLLWQREDEFGFEPLGSAMSIRLEATLGPDGLPADLLSEIWSAPHVGNTRAGANLLATRALPNPPPAIASNESSNPDPGAGTRNAAPYYAIPEHRLLHHFIPRGPVRTSSLRGLGALPNVFALECFLDELAAFSHTDPLDYRLAMLPDPRARAVLSRAAEMAGWARRGPSGSGTGLGLGFSRYKNRAGYAAVVAEVVVEREVRVARVWCAADAGLVINPDGLINQLEGGIVQAASWVLKEQVAFDAAGIASRNWDSYPILRFSEIPEIRTELLDPGDQPPLGVGECTMGPTAGAIGNAVAHALGARIRDMPFTRERILAAIG
jgi:CO/xanthine dehydrogenase Mo-binding subunit